LASLTTIFKNEATDPHEADKLVDLFRNRAELKKEFAALRNEKYQLQDRIKHHQGATARVQQQLLHLENLLLDPEWVYNVVAFYQLRGLAEHCRNQLIRFSEQLKQKKEQRVHSKMLVSWNEQKQRKSGQIENRIGEHRMALQLLEDRLQSERHKLMTMSGFSKLLRGRSVAAEISDIETRIEAAQAQEHEILDELDAVNKLSPPDHQGLDTDAKRAINFMMLAFAQHLSLQFEAYNIVELAKEASEKSVGAINYGSKGDCDAILGRLAELKNAEDGQTDRAEILRKRAMLIAEHAKFRNGDDTVPVPGTVNTVFAINANGTVERQDANILGNNYFGIAKVLSR